MVRVVTGAVLLLIVWACNVPASPIVFVGLVLVGALLAAWECYDLLERNAARPLRWLGLAGTAAVVWSFARLAPEWDPAAALVLCTIAAATASMALRPAPPAMLATLWTTLFPVVFVGLTLGHLVALRCLPGEAGKPQLLLLFVCVIVGDSAAFYAGTRFGRRRLAPTLSPNKTWEGAAAGLLGSVLGALVVRAWFHSALPAAHAVLLGVLLGVAAIGGDLAESLLKRVAQTKDSSRLIPGHGGVLDRTDSLLFAGPILYYYWRLFLRESG